jgi:hypothetical protein
MHLKCPVGEAFGRQMRADSLQGYDYIGYHAYAKRRYFELVGGERGWEINVEYD